MSLPVRAGNSGISRDDTKENQRPKGGQRAGNSKRPVLGNVTNQVRRQPQRNAKDRHSIVQAGTSKSGRNSGGQENEGPSNARGKGAAGFAIFEDGAPPPRVPAIAPQVHEEEPMQDQENLIPGHNLVLHDAVVGLRPAIPHHPHIAPLAPLQLDQVLIGSPMAVEDVKDEEEETRTSRPDEFGLDPYFTDIYNYMRSMECVYRPARDYMNRQTDVSTSMRNILVDWLIEVGEEYKLHRETLFLAIAYIDRFLSLVGVQRPKLQLVGTASMFIASKYEEIYPPDVSEFVYITDDTYTRGQVLKMEGVVLKLLNFKVSIPTINWFCDRFLDLVTMSAKAKHLAYFLAELSLIEIEEFLEYRPSMLAASSIILARCTLREGVPWPSRLEKISGYSLPSLNACVNCLFRLYSRKASMPQQAVVEKYKQDKFGAVSLIEPPPVLTLH